MPDLISCWPVAGEGHRGRQERVADPGTMHVRGHVPVCWAAPGGLQCGCWPQAATTPSRVLASAWMFARNRRSSAHRVQHCCRSVQQQPGRVLAVASGRRGGAQRLRPPGPSLAVWWSPSHARRMSPPCRSCSGRMPRYERLPGGSGPGRQTLRLVVQFPRAFRPRRQKEACRSPFCLLLPCWSGVCCRRRQSPGRRCR